MANSSRNHLPPNVPYNPDWPICNCGRPMEHDSEDRKFRCNYCTISVQEAWVKQSPLVKNRDKTLAERATMSKEDQQQEIDNRNRILTQAAQERAKLQTQRGEDFETGNTGASSTNNNKDVFFQLPSPHDIAKRNNAISSGRYSDHTRSSGREPYTNPHPLDRELIDKGFRITKSFELDRLPNSKDIVPKNIRGERKPYDRYGQQSDSTNGVDIYDGV